MDKKLRDYNREVERKIKNIKTKNEAKELLVAHEIMLAHFQHERFVHLIVTMFFALFLLLCFGFTMLLGIFTAELGDVGRLLTLGFGVITLILLVTTLFYAAHYYKLENGTQRLEEATKRLLDF